MFPYRSGACAITPASPHEMLKASMTCNASVHLAEIVLEWFRSFSTLEKSATIKGAYFSLLNVTKSVFSNKVQKCINNIIWYKEVKIQFYKYLMNELDFYTVVYCFWGTRFLLLLHILLRYRAAICASVTYSIQRTATDRRWAISQSNTPPVRNRLLVEIISSRAVFGLHNRKSGVNGHLGFCPFQKNSEMCHVWVRIIHLTMAPTRQISELKYTPTHGTYRIFFNGQACKFVHFTPDLRLFKANTKRDEGISATSQTQHRRTANIRPAVTSSNTIFLHRIAESSQPSIIL